MKLRYPNYEVILVDNASTDGSVRVVERKFPSMQIIRNHTNLGYVGGMNTGIRNARGELFALLCIDTEVHPDWLSELAKVAQKTHIAACFGKFYDYNDKKRFTGANMLFRINRNTRFQDVVQEASTASGSAWLVKRSVIEVVGLFDDKYFMYFDEVDLCWRMRIASYRIMYVPDAIAYHRSGSQMKSEYRTYLDTRNWIRSILKNCSIETLLLYQFFIPLKFFLALLSSFSLKKKQRANGRIRLLQYLRACIWNARLLRDTICKRKAIQKLRKISDRNLHLFNFVISNPYITINRSLLP
jgi:hypothetical protein